MKDYLLRVLRKNRDELQKMRVRCWEEHLAAQEDLQTVTGILESAERIMSMLDQASKADRSRLMDILSSYPDMEELKLWHKTAQDKVRSTAQAHEEVRRARKKASEEFSRRDEYCRTVKSTFGTVLARELKPQIRSEVITYIKRGRLHIFWGGKNHPLGPGHGHCVLTKQKLVFRRNPVRLTP